MPPLISIKNLEKHRGARCLFSGITLHFDAGERCALIGPNGSGKSTLLRILAGEEEPDGGEIFRRRGARIVYLPQQDSFTHQSVGPCLEAALARTGGEVQAGAVARLAGRFGLSRLDQDIRELSGGQRKWLAIARAMAAEPDLLLLDEPGNHLDLPALLRLEQLLAAARFGFVLVSHDRCLLDAVCARTVEINPCFAQGFLSRALPFSRFLDARAEYLEQQRRQEAGLASRMRREMEWLMRSPKARATKARFRVEEAGRLRERLEGLRRRNREERAPDLDFAATGRRTRKLLRLEGVGMSRGGRVLFQDLSLEMGPGECLGLVGANGCGKSSLMHLMAGEIEPDRGRVRLAEGLRVRLFRQQDDGHAPGTTLARALAPEGDSVVFQGRGVHVVSWAARFLFRKEQLDLPVSRLSGGERARIRLAHIMRTPADLLLLDEPTNDLDVGSIAMLEQALADFPGALVLVSHDRAFLDALADRVLGFDGQGGVEVFADTAQWIARLREQGRPQREKRRGKEGGRGGRRAARTRRALTYAERLELAAMEDRIMEAEAELEQWCARVRDPGVMADPRALAECGERIQACRKAVDALYARWEELERKQEEGER